MFILSSLIRKKIIQKLNGGIGPLKRKVHQILESYQIIVYVLLGFGIIILTTWVDELFDVPYLFLGGQKTGFNWREALIESLVIFFVALFVWLVIIENIRKRKVAEKSLQQYARDLQKFQLAVDKASDHIVITDPRGIILYANEAVEKITGFSRHALIGQMAGSSENWGGQMSKDFYKAMWQRISKDRKPFVGEITNRKKDGSLYVTEVHISPVLDKDAKIAYFVSIEIDISRMKEIDRAKNEFVSLASHQLRTPLTSISLSLDLLLRGTYGKVSHEQKEILASIHEDINETAEMISDLLNLSRIEMGTFKAEIEAVNIKKISELLIKEIEPQIAQKNINFKKVYDLPRDIWALNKNVLKIVLQNLLSNAVKYTKEQGDISMEIRKDKNNLLISVADTGIGIALSDQARLFTKFFRTTKAKRLAINGTGLGLNLSKSILEAVGGKIWFKSKENIGSIFYATMPLKKVD